MLVTLKGFSPPQRYDGIPFTHARLEESAVEAGPFTTVQTFTLSPVDVDPSNPFYRDFTTELATQPDGWYRIVFVDADGDESLPTDALQYRASLASEIRPTVRDLSTLMRARTKGQYANQGVFNNDTVPTAEQADDLIDLATDIVLIKVGDELAARFYKHARSTILFKAAALVELTYYPEQANDDNSAYSLYQAQYNELMGTLVIAIRVNPTENSASVAFASIPTMGRNGYNVPIYAETFDELLP